MLLLHIQNINLDSNKHLSNIKCTSYSSCENITFACDYLFIFKVDSTFSLVECTSTLEKKMYFKTNSIWAQAHRVKNKSSYIMNVMF